jgi:hypothetical protein
LARYFITVKEPKFFSSVSRLEPGCIFEVGDVVDKDNKPINDLTLQLFSSISILRSMVKISPQGADAPPPPSTGRNHLNEEITPSSSLAQASDIAKPYQI